MAQPPILKLPQLTTERLLLRRWLPADLEPFAAINRDAAVMEHFPAPLSRPETAALIARNEDSFERLGYGAWAVELRGEARLIGMVGLMPVPTDLPFAGVELAWRLAHSFWGRGLAREAALAALEFAFTELQLERVVAYTAARNRRSRTLMERLTMSRNPAEDFLHPGLAASDPLAAHVLYRLDSPLMRSASAAGSP